MAKKKNEAFEWACDLLLRLVDVDSEKILDVIEAQKNNDVEFVKGKLDEMIELMQEIRAEL
jgi:hypothetical protein